MLWVAPISYAARQVPQLATRPGWTELPAVRQNRVYAVDANSYFARPGPRVVEGVELLAHLIHPDLCKWGGPGDAFQAIDAASVSIVPVRTQMCEGSGLDNDSF